MLKVLCTDCGSRLDLEPLVKLEDLVIFWMSCEECGTTGMLQFSLAD